jgi:hypothetical protein
MLYDRPISALMREAAADLTPPYTLSDFVTWFGEHYPKVNPKSVRAHIIGLTANPSDRVVGQILRYIGYVQIHMAAPGQAVEGLIIGHDADDALRYAVSAIPTIRLMTYQVAFSLTATELPYAEESASLA